MSFTRLILVALCLALAGCGEPYPHTFRIGEIAIVKLDGQRVQITDIYPYSENVRVRVPLSTGGYKYINLEESALAKP